MPEIVPNVQGTSYDVPRIIQTSLAIVGAIVGGYYSALGVYLISTGIPHFSNLSAPFLIIVTGLLTVVASKTAMNGVLLDNASYMRTLSVMAWLIIIAEAWIVLKTLGKPSTDDYRFAWSHIHSDNRWQLVWFENRFGCCGFESAQDMPSSKQCAESGRVNGCLRPLRRHAMHLNGVAMEWTLVTVLVQAVVFALGSFIYSRASSSGWLVEESDEELMGEPQELGQSTPAIVAPPPTSPAEAGDVSGRQHGETAPLVPESNA